MSEAKVYVAMLQTGECRVCKKIADLRIGVCFQCCDKMDGALVSPGLHRLFEIANPGNCWFYSERTQ